MKKLCGRYQWAASAMVADAARGFESQRRISVHPAQGVSIRRRGLASLYFGVSVPRNPMAPYVGLAQLDCPVAMQRR